ncbi:MAG: NYN domain-containing protein [Candidatus Altiarchaeota archaeon]|nr:NYN domain-containing protein [Candidatus Altiarchaeota archaeon]
MPSIERVIVFIDGGNFYHACKENLGTKKIDFSKLAKLLIGKRKRIRNSQYYTVPPRSNMSSETIQDQQRFLDWVNHLPDVDLRLGKLKKKDVKCFKCRQTFQDFTEKKVDVMIASDMLEACYKNQADTLILVSGDNDFTYVVDKITSGFKIKVEVSCFKNSLSRELGRSANKVIFLDNLGIDKKCARPPLVVNP